MSKPQFMDPNPIDIIILIALLGAGCFLVYQHLTRPLPPRPKPRRHYAPPPPSFLPPLLRGDDAPTDEDL